MDIVMTTRIQPRKPSSMPSPTHRRIRRSLDNTKISPTMSAVTSNSADNGEVTTTAASQLLEACGQIKRLTALVEASRKGEEKMREMNNRLRTALKTERDSAQERESRLMEKISDLERRKSLNSTVMLSGKENIVEEQNAKRKSLEEGHRKSLSSVEGDDTVNNNPASNFLQKIASLESELAELKKKHRKLLQDRSFDLACKQQQNIRCGHCTQVFEPPQFQTHLELVMSQYRRMESRVAVLEAQLASSSCEQHHLEEGVENLEKYAFPAVVDAPEESGVKSDKIGESNNDDDKNRGAEESIALAPVLYLDPAARLENTPMMQDKRRSVTKRMDEGDRDDDDDDDDDDEDDESDTSSSSSGGELDRDDDDVATIIEHSSLIEEEANLNNVENDDDQFKTPKMK